MKRLLLFALIVAAAWYGWKHQEELRHRGTHEIVVMNNSARLLERVRISVAGQDFAIESIAPGAMTRLALRSERDGPFEIYWNVHGSDAEHHWQGGGFNHGPILMRHRLEFEDGDGVVWTNERIAAKAPESR